MPAAHVRQAIKVPPRGNTLRTSARRRCGCLDEGSAVFGDDDDGPSLVGRASLAADYQVLAHLSEAPEGRLRSFALHAGQVLRQAALLPMQRISGRCKPACPNTWSGSCAASLLHSPPPSQFGCSEPRFTACHLLHVATATTHADLLGPMAIRPPCLRQHHRRSTSSAKSTCWHCASHDRLADRLPRIAAVETAPCRLVSPGSLSAYCAKTSERPLSGILLF